MNQFEANFDKLNSILEEKGSTSEKYNVFKSLDNKFGRKKSGFKIVKYDRRSNNT